MLGLLHSYDADDLRIVVLGFDDEVYRELTCVREGVRRVLLMGK